MSIDEYAERRDAILRRMIAALYWLLLAFLIPGIDRQTWNRLLHAVYPTFKRHRDEATELAREFYDATRAQQLPNEPRHDIFKDDHFPESWFREALEPTFKDFTRYRNRNAALQDFTSRLVKEVEDGARRTIIEGVESDESQVIRGWARFDPRPPTCAFCTMMISRGPVYGNAMNAGVDLDDESAQELWEQNDTQAMNAMMHKWHPKCTCIAVPVYSYKNYPTEQQEKAALEIYNRARKAANSGDFKEILKAMRRSLYKKDEREDEVDLAA